ncbi:MAG: hypothetical protein AAFR14_04520 [Bacteroidota bacterium]
METGLQTLLIVAGVIGTALTVYFGYFRALQYRWTQKKIQYDLIGRFGARHERILPRLSSMYAVGDPSARLIAKRKAVILSYLQLQIERFMVISQDEVAPKTALMWISAWHSEMDFLTESSIHFWDEIKVAADYLDGPFVSHLHDWISQYESGSIDHGRFIEKLKSD